MPITAPAGARRRRLMYAVIVAAALVSAPGG